ncbi:hypothetical protein [Xanthomonas translucens]|uniref:hypothetical protein n=1 Tax=Xanthomonas campestris pv. translucens TaxID=343 RepID=UPI00071E79E0|nr:hypothetical protein [Xanthomonas translucens]QEN93664.1 hypothetical protein F0H33_09975 [Xanthomonas translucens pv. undulosa]QSQ58021.1 hypothetical protein ISN37_08845 [Xanthomonas translucens pv. undulosa]UPU47733.1 hypothetical protein MZO50_13320 [Xanthomonas translucens pv. undulosa]WLA02829.1 hypothetical protein MO330_10090 [Xanthomonas translucens]WLA06579.1 hypothetical protein MO329_10020 [Xanthomonas translucens]
MRTINITTVDANLLADLDGNAAGYTAYQADYEQATVSNQCYHIVYNADDGYGGIVFVGSGSNGVTSWTSASSAEDVLGRFERDEMTP